MENVELMQASGRAEPVEARRRSFARATFLELKGTMDFVVATILLVFALPLILALALVVKLTSRGPVIFAQRRVGRGGRIFKMLKFRTMVRNAEAYTGAVWATENDPRTTRVGRFLRATHLDELPQLINVIRGDMSIVGPRPERPPFVKIFAESIPRYVRRHSVKPGITGLAQVYHKYDETMDDVRKKLAFDLLYIRRMCWMVDLMIMWLTLGRVVRREIR